MIEQTNAMIGRELLKTAAKFGLMAAMALSGSGELSASSGPGEATSGSEGNKPAVTANPLKPPAQGSIPVAFLVSEGAVIIDFCGPWEVFQDVNIPRPPGRTIPSLHSRRDDRTHSGKRWDEDCTRLHS
jgi:hypothetical protein